MHISIYGYVAYTTLTAQQTRNAIDHSTDDGGRWLWSNTFIYIHRIIVADRYSGTGNAFDWYFSLGWFR